MSVSAVFIPWQGANGMSLLTNDALEQANIRQIKVSVVQVFLARENDLTDPEGVVQKGRY